MAMSEVSEKSLSLVLAMSYLSSLIVALTNCSSLLVKFVDFNKRYANRSSDHIVAFCSMIGFFEFSKKISDLCTRVALVCFE